MWKPNISQQHDMGHQCHPPNPQASSNSAMGGTVYKPIGFHTHANMALFVHIPES